MNIERDSYLWKWIILACIAMFPMGAYFVYDAPAALQRYFLAGLELNSSEYMAYYTAYSAPNIIFCILGGILVDNVFGRRLGAIIFCGFVFAGQALFALGVSLIPQNSNWKWLGYAGRSITGMGVESIAVASKCFLSWWYKGTPMNSFAFGFCIAFWRISSSFSLMTMLPYYNSINTLTPQDGLTNEFNTCKSCWNLDNKGENPIKSSDTTEKKMANFKFLDEYNIENYTDDTMFYCYDKNILESCQMNNKKINFWNQGEKINACTNEQNQVFDQQTRDFIKKAKIEEFNCFNPETFQFDSEKCNCLITSYRDNTDPWSWADNLHKTHSLDDRWDPENKFTDEVINSLRNPWYFTNNMGEYLTGDNLKLKNEYFDELNKFECEQKHNIPYNQERFIKGDNDRWSVDTFVTTLDRPGLYGFSSKCDKSTTVLAAIPEEDSTLRVEALESCYYTMLIVPVVAVCIAGLLSVLDGKAEKQWNEANPDKVEEKKPITTFGDIIKSIKQIPATVWLIYLMVVTFYVPVFIFVSQAPKFFEDHLGIEANLAPKATGQLYVFSIFTTLGLGAIVSYTKNHNVWLVGAFVLAGCSHLLMCVFGGFMTALLGMFMLAFAYGIIGTCMWPLIGILAGDDLTAKAYGLAYALQQIGLTVSAATVGWLKDKAGYMAVETFFISCTIIGGLTAFYLLTKLGRHMPEAKKAGDDAQDEQEMKQLNE